MNAVMQSMIVDPLLLSMGRETVQAARVYRQQHLEGRMAAEVAAAEAKMFLKYVEAALEAVSGQRSIPGDNAERNFR